MNAAAWDGTPRYVPTAFSTAARASTAGDVVHARERPVSNTVSEQHGRRLELRHRPS
jgi:hypothetical protein